MQTDSQTRSDLMRTDATGRREQLFHIRGADLDLSGRTYVVGILNVTPDSFSDGGRYVNRDAALRHAERMVQEGADFIDVGGESTRPYAAPVSEAEETARVIPVISMLSKRSDVIISIDTTKASVARAALDAGAHIINDVSALRFDSDIANVAAQYGAGLVLMHMKGTPRTMQENPEYDDLLAEITSFLDEAINKACNSGVRFESIILDPGIGFGKKLKHNLAILKNLSELKVLKRPIMVGPSRKSFIGRLLDRPVGDRVSGTLAAVAVSIFSGASVVRVHDVKEAKEATIIVDAIMRS